MDKIPPALVKSLTELGLLESEAKIYIALVMMNSSDVKELIDFVGISKPNTYEGLRSLEEKGLIVAVSQRPIAYQAISPEIGLEMLIDRHMKAKNEAAKLFSALPRDIRENPPDNMWFIFNEKNLDYKMRDMIRNAKASVIFLGSDRYLKYLKPLARKDVRLELTVISEKPDARDTAQKMFGDGKAIIRIVDHAEAVRMLSLSKMMGQKEYLPSLEEVFRLLNYEKMLILVVDDAEFLYAPPFFSDGAGAMNSRSKTLIENMKVVQRAIGTYFAGKSEKK